MSKKNKQKRKEIEVRQAAEKTRKPETLYSLYKFTDPDNMQSGQAVGQFTGLKELRRHLEQEAEWTFEGEFNELSVKSVSARNAVSWEKQDWYMATSAPMKEVCIQVGESIDENADIWMYYILREPEVA